MSCLYYQNPSFHLSIPHKYQHAHAIAKVWALVDGPDGFRTLEYQNNFRIIYNLLHSFHQSRFWIELECLLLFLVWSHFKVIAKKLFSFDLEPYDFAFGVLVQFAGFCFLVVLCLNLQDPMFFPEIQCYPGPGVLPSNNHHTQTQKQSKQSKPTNKQTHARLIVRSFLDKQTQTSPSQTYFFNVGSTLLLSYLNTPSQK